MDHTRGGRIDDQALFRLLTEEGRSQRDAAEFFGVSEAAVSKRVKVLNLNLTRHVGLERAKAVADHGLDVAEQLQGINRAILSSWSGRSARRGSLARIAEKAQGHGARRVITFVDHHNVPALKGCQRAGFSPYLIRVDRWRLFRRRVTFRALPPKTPYPFEA